MIEFLSKITLKKDHYFNISFARILLYSFMFYRASEFIAFSHYLKLPDLMFQANGLIFSLEFKRVVQSNQDALAIAFYIALFFSAIGFLTRLSTIFSFLIAYIFFSIPRAYSSNLYLFIPILSLLFFMCLCRSGDYLSLDSFIFKKEKAPKRFEFFWTTHMCRFVLVNYFFSSGFLKLFKTGTAWFLGNTLTNNFLCSPFARNDFVPSYISAIGFNNFLARFPVFFQLAALVSIVAELLAPLMLFFKNIRYTLLLFFIFFQAFAFFSLYINASINIPLYFFWINWRFVYLNLKRLSRTCLARK